MIKSRFLRWGDYPGLSGWAHWNHKSLYRKEAGDQREREKVCQQKQETGGMQEGGSL